jgi:hypothetical protein
MNIIEVYEKLLNADIVGETVDYNRGFADCVYMLKLVLQKYEHINLHIENRNLKRRLLISDLNLDDSLFSLIELRKEVAELKKKIKSPDAIRQKVNVTNGLSLVELTVADFTFDFYGDLDQQDIDGHSVLIGQYIAEKLSKSRRKGRPRHATDYKAWTMQYLRDAGYKLSA